MDVSFCALPQVRIGERPLLRRKVRCVNYHKQMDGNTRHIVKSNLLYGHLLFKMACLWCRLRPARPGRRLPIVQAIDWFVNSKLGELQPACSSTEGNKRYIINL